MDSISELPNDSTIDSANDSPKASPNDSPNELPIDSPNVSPKELPEEPITGTGFVEGPKMEPNKLFCPELFRRCICRGMAACLMGELPCS